MIGEFFKMEDIELVQILWDYMKLNQKIEKCDAIRYFKEMQNIITILLTL